MNQAVGYVPGRNALYGRKELSRLFDPRSVALVGASETPGSFGLRTIENVSVGYAGELYLVNPRYEKILGRRCYPSLGALPQVPDCVIVAVPKEHVEPLAQQAAALGVGGMIVYTAGFAEVGAPDRIAAQQRLAALARTSSMRILGPNCVGTANLVSRVGLNFMPKFNEMPQMRGTVGLISQSGALGYVVLQALERGVGFSHFLTSGNSCDVDVCDLINYLVEDEATRVIACMFEGVRDGDRLQQAARRALAADKPLLIYKLANSEVSRKTALSHTGTLAGARSAYRAAFERNGVVVIDNWEELLETALFFSKAGRPSASGVGVMASSGGAAVMAADKCEELGLSLPAPAAETAAKLAAVVPAFGSVANPSDITAESLKSNQMYGDCIRAFADDASYGAIVVPMMSAHKPATVQRAEYLCGFAAELKKPMCLVWLNEWYQGPGSELYDACRNISTFRSMGRCLNAIRLWLDHYAKRDELLRTREARDTKAAAEKARALIASAGGGRSLSESSSKRVLAAYGVAVTQEILTADADAAVRAAGEIDYPVALKVDSAQIPHKTEAGVIRLQLNDAAAVGRAYDELIAAAAALPGNPVVNGVLVQQMAGKGVEMMIGARVDPQFGPLVLCGFGGIGVELTGDVAVALAPVDRKQAIAMIRSLKGARMLTGFRNLPPLDVDALAEAVCRVSELVADLQDVIGEIDVNPVIVGVRGGLAVDALIVCKEANQ